MKITIPIGSQISQTNNKTIEIKVPNTKFWVMGQQLPTKLWNAYLINPESNYKEILRKDTTTESFALFSSIILKTPFPYNGKRTEDSTEVKKFIKKLIKTKRNGIKKHTRS